MAIRGGIARAVAVVTLLASCAGGAHAGDVAAPVVVREDVTVAKSLAITAMTQEDFLVTIKGLLSGREHADQSDADYIQGGKDICADIAAGSTMSSFMAQVDATGGDRAFYRAAIRASVNTFCVDSASALYR